MTSEPALFLAQDLPVRVIAKARDRVNPNYPTAVRPPNHHPRSES